MGVAFLAAVSDCCFLLLRRILFIPFVVVVVVGVVSFWFWFLGHSRSFLLSYSKSTFIYLYSNRRNETERNESKRVLPSPNHTYLRHSIFGLKNPIALHIHSFLATGLLKLCISSQLQLSPSWPLLLPSPARHQPATRHQAAITPPPIRLRSIHPAKTKSSLLTDHSLLPGMYVYPSFPPIAPTSHCFQEKKRNPPN